MRQFVPLLLVLTVFSVLVGPYYSLFPAYVERELGQSPSLTGILLAISTISMAAFFVVGGAVADSFGSRRALLVGMAGLALSGVFFLVFSLPILVVLSVVFGLSSAFQTTGAMSYLMRAVSTSRLGIGTGIFFVTMTLGNALGNFIFGPVADRWGYHPMGWIMFTGITATVLVGWIALPEIGSTTHRQPSMGETLRGYREILLNEKIRWLLGVRFFPTCMWGAASVAFPYLFFIATGKNQAPAFFATSSLVGAAVAQLVTGRICDRFGIRRTIRVVAVLIPITTLMTGALAHSIAGLWICGILYTCAAWALSTTMPPLMNAITSKEESGRIVGVTHIAWAAGMALGQAGAGWLVGIDPSTCYYVGTVFCIGGIYCAWRVA